MKALPADTADPEYVTTPAGEKTFAYRDFGIAWGLSRTVVSVVICGDAAVVLANLWNARTGPIGVGLAFVLLAAMLSVQLLHFSRRGARLHSPRSYALLGAQACLAYLPFLVFGEYWDGVPSFLAGSLLLTLPTLPAAGSLVAVAASVAVIQTTQPGSWVSVPYIFFTVATFGLEIYLLTRLAALIGELDSARDELAQLAVAQERLRFARDLHDLLGLSLSAITLKGELAYRLMYKDPTQARNELDEILSIARRALTDLRSVATGYQELSLEQECRSAESVLTASNVRVNLEANYADLPTEVRTVLGAVLREGVTNVLRHSKAEHCDILIRGSRDGVSLDIVNDGIVEQTGVVDEHGSGTHNVAERVAAQGGSVSSGLEEGRRHYRLHVHIPLAAADVAPGRPWRAVAPRRHNPDREPRDGIWLRSTTSINGWPIRTLIALVFVGMTISACFHLLALTHNVGDVVSGVGYLAALLALQLAYANRLHSLQRSVQGYALLFVQACLTYLPMVELGNAWVSMPGLLVGCALVVLPRPLGWTVLAASVGATAWHFALTGPADLAASAANVLITGLVVFGLTSLSQLVRELNTARTELAQMAIARERLLFTEDLHHLLGRSLSTISIKIELTRRLANDDTDQVMQELGEILQLARQALADVRSVAHGYRELSLDDESRSARSVLVAADVAVRMNIDYGDLPVLVRTVLAVALREAVTNILRHSRAQHCEISIAREDGRVSLTIVNDGVIAPNSNEAGAEDGIDGTAEFRTSGGVASLGHRFRQLNGELTAGPTSDGRFRMRASVPV